MAVIWALLSAISYGLADLSAREASKYEGTVKTIFYLQLIGVPVAAVILFLSPHSISLQTLFSEFGLIMIGMALLHNVGALLLYRALLLGPLLIVSPITSCFSAVTLGLAMFSGERPTLIQLAGTGLILLGIMLAATTPDASDSKVVAQRSSLGIMYALMAAALLGVELWLFRFVVPILGEEITTFSLRLGALGWMTIYFLLKQRRPLLRSKVSAWWLLPLGMFDTIAVMFYTLSVKTGLTSIVSVITSLHSVVVVVLGYLFWHERITLRQQVGIGISFFGIVCVNF